MPKEISGINQFTDPVTVPIDGDPVIQTGPSNIGSERVYQALANRDQYLRQLIVASGANQIVSNTGIITVGVPVSSQEIALFIGGDFTGLNTTRRLVSMHVAYSYTTLPTSATTIAVGVWRVQGPPSNIPPTGTVISGNPAYVNVVRNGQHFMPETAQSAVDAMGTWIDEVPIGEQWSYFWSYWGLAGLEIVMSGTFQVAEML